MERTGLRSRSKNFGGARARGTHRLLAWSHRGVPEVIGATALYLAVKSRIEANPNPAFRTRVVSSGRCYVHWNGEPRDIT
jgi:hypothetical protein